MTTSKLICNAGFNAASILPDGSVNTCYDRKNENLGNINTGFEFRKKLVECDLVHCACPLWAFEKELHKKAKGEEAIERPYQAYLHWHVTYECQMMCNYCIVTGPDKKTDTEDKLRKSTQIDIKSVVNTLDKTGLTYYISMMGGEPFLVPNMTELVLELQKKHIVGFNTNLATMDPNFWKIVDTTRLGNFHISLHIQPMEKRGLTDRFLENLLAMKASGFTNYYITAVAHPNMLAKFTFYKNFFDKHDVKFQLIPMIEGGGSTGGKVYPESYTEDELKLINTDWLNDYFPQKNAINEKPKIENFRPRNPKNQQHELLDYKLPKK